MIEIIIFLRNILFILLFAVIQTSFIFLFPHPLDEWQIYLSFLIPFLVLFENNRQIIWWSVVFGLILSLFTIYQIFILPLLFVALILLINFILKNFITNRSLYTIFVLSILITFLYNFILFSISLSLNYIYFSSSNILIIPTLINFLWQILLNTTGSSLFFFLLKKIK
jgi:hypothetical protein